MFYLLLVIVSGLLNYSMAQNLTFQPIRNNIVSDNDVILHLHTRSNPKNSVQLDRNKLANVIKGRVTKFICHGWLENGNESWMMNMTEQYLIKGDYNVIRIDWSNISHQNYITTTTKVRGIGKVIGDYIIKLHSQGMSLKNVHIVGHSLGAQIAGFAGKDVKAKTGSKIFRITGLDAASVLFTTTNPSKKLTANDAEQVDLIHTDGLVYGYWLAQGTVDFYPNGGIRYQPGCSPFPTSNTKDLNSFIFCSHRKSYAYFLSSINSNKLFGQQCDSWLAYIFNMCNNNIKIPFGENCPPNARGKYYLKTNSQPPFHNV